MQSGGMRHPRELGAADVEAFLSMLTNERKVSASTHNQALSAVLFLYREVLGIDLPWLNNIGRPQQTKRIPSVLTKDEVAGLLAQMDGVTALLARLLYGTGMRLMEGMRLRIKDVDFERQVIIVREAKGAKDRVVMLPRSLAPALRLQMLAARAQWEADRQVQRGGVEVPHAAPFVCHAPAAIGHRHPHGARTAGSLGCIHHHDLYTCTQGGSRRYGQPFGFTASGLSRLHKRTGTPRSRMRSLACCTVYSP